MGKFDGFLICSDLDNTFRAENSVEINTNAIEYFKKNGGRFTFATGRSVEYLRNPEFFNLMNAPACLCNGGIIYDYKNDKLLKEERLDFTFGEFLENMNEPLKKAIRFAVFHSVDEDSIIVDSVDKVGIDMNMKLIKIVCVFENVSDADEFKEKARKMDFFKSTYISKSWPVGVEFNSIKATKGCSVKFIKDYIGNIRTTIGAGDFENDITLLSDSDFGVAPENAIDSLKEGADFVVCHAKDGVIKEIIELIENGKIHHK